jgi:hypothetical protein
MSTQSYASLYSITLHQLDTNQTEISSMFLIRTDYKNMLKKLNEIVYVDEEGKEWALQEIKLNDRRPT